MSQAAVQAIFNQIQKLTEEDRMLLEQRLSEAVEQEWRQEADAARHEAQRRGLSQADIDRAVREVRYRQ